MERGAEALWGKEPTLWIFFDCFYQLVVRPVFPVGPGHKCGPLVPRFFSWLTEAVVGQGGEQVLAGPALGWLPGPGSPLVKAPTVPIDELSPEFGRPG